MNIACLISDAYGSFGGIARFNRDFLDALDRCDLVRRVFVFPRIIPNKTFKENIPQSVMFFRQAAQGRFAYVKCIIDQIIFGPVCDIIVCGHINIFSIAYFYAKIRRKKVILIVHGIDAWTPNPRRITNLLVRRADMVVSVSQFTANRLARWSKVPKEKVFVLPNCVDLERFVPLPRDPSVRHRFGWTDRQRVLLTMGRLANAERYKGFDEVIEILPDLVQLEPNIRYLVVGDGSDRARLTKKVAALGIGDIVAFAGQIKDDERTAFYNAADVYVMPSRGEGFGIVLLEAAACGLPIIGSAVDGSAEALLHGKLGRLIDPGDREALKTAVLDQLSLSAPRTRSEAINYFSQKSYHNRVEDLILRVAGEGRSSDANSPVDVQPTALS